MLYVFGMLIVYCVLCDGLIRKVCLLSGSTSDQHKQEDERTGVIIMTFLFI